jgi:histidinol-phosphatase
MNLQPYFDFATALAYNAGKITLRYFNAGVQAEYKDGDQVVTIADREAELFVRSEIEKKFPSHRIIGEEFGESGDSKSPFRWTVDPIDGTIAFVHGIPLYGVLIALEIEGAIRVGAAYYPPLNEMLNSAEGMGAWLNGRRVQVSQIDQLSQACIVSSDFQKTAQKDVGIVNRFVQAKMLLRTWGDAYGYALVATGRAEVCLDPVMAVWDNGPFSIILPEAGGYFGSWLGEAGHAYGEALACNLAIKPHILKLMRGD